ncbi:hypothetical protein Xhom_00099 [Xenorhabdus hominickii]|uniref:Uncharacterized protein n=1 Tax=Xenorhabdus hominickii TaxID=351679 RepID=A0A2G0QD28_XENHO|nr:hypothetical protein Xhom_02236 [Xenorhabdus hominickii]PHM57142.1 hypothetical protein Xhom_00099 [Xenorhabdus hominickii]
MLADIVEVFKLSIQDTIVYCILGFLLVIVSGLIA